MTVLLAPLYPHYLYSDTLHAKTPSIASLRLILAGTRYNLYLAGFAGFITYLLGVDDTH